MSPFRRFLLLAILFLWLALSAFLFFSQKNNTLPPVLLKDPASQNPSLPQNLPLPDSLKENTKGTLSPPEENPEEKKENTPLLPLDLEKQAPLSPFSLLNEDSCRDCHPEVYQEWQQSAHAQAFTNIEFQIRLETFRPQECLPCHIPQPLLLQKDSLIQARSDHLERGISCLSCHQEKEGIASTALDPSPYTPHALVSSLALREDTLCIQCHRSLGETFKKNQQSGQTCRSCHMPEQKRLRPSKSKGYSHLFLGRHRQDFMKTALPLEIQQDPQFFTLQLSNPSVPHHLPGERHFRQLLLFVEIWKKDSSDPTAAYLEIIKNISLFRRELESDKIQPQQKVSYRYAKEEGDFAEIRVVYKRFPTLLDEEGMVIHQLQLPLK
jgi:hypothetical protein